MLTCLALTCQVVWSIRAYAVPTTAATEYAEWVARCASGPQGRSVGGNPVSWKLIITVVEREEDRAPGGAIRQGSVVFGAQISTGGAVDYFHRSDFAHKGSGSTQLSDEALAKLDLLLAALPDDHRRLPPAGRRLMLQTFDGERSTIRVFDRANAPPEVCEILRLSQSGIRSWVSEFEPRAQIKAGDFEHGGAFYLTPDDRALAMIDGHGRVTLWDVVSHEKRGEARITMGPSNGFALTSDRKLMAVEYHGECAVFDTTSWAQLCKFAEPWIDRRQAPLWFPQFTPDNRHLLLSRADDAIKVIDTSTWRETAPLPDLPADVLQCVLAPTHGKAVIVSKTGALSLWDLNERTALAQLDDQTSIEHVAFSPDESRVAIATSHER